jgi:hypothetical protein
MANITFATTNVDSKNICQFKRNPHLETTSRAGLNPKHVDARARIVQETTCKISQTAYCWWHVRRLGWVGPDSGESFGRVSRRRGEVSTIAIVILSDLLHQLIWLDRYVEKKGCTHRSGAKRVCLWWDRIGNSVIPMHVRILILRNLGILPCVSPSEWKHITR